MILYIQSFLFLTSLRKNIRILSSWIESTIVSSIFLFELFVTTLGTAGRHSEKYINFQKSLCHGFSTHAVLSFCELECFTFNQGNWITNTHLFVPTSLTFSYKDILYGTLWTFIFYRCTLESINYFHTRDVRWNSILFTLAYLFRIAFFRKCFLLHLAGIFYASRYVKLFVPSIH